MREKHYRSILQVCSLSTLLLLAVLFGPQLLVAQDANVSVLKQQIQEKNNAIAKLEAEIASYQRELNAVSQEAQSLANTVRQFDLTRQKLATEIRLTSEEITQKNYRIDELELDINDKNRGISANTLALAKSLRSISELDDTTLFEVLLMEENIADLWNYIDQLRQFQSELRQHTDELVVLKDNLLAVKSEIEKNKQQLEVLKQDLADQKKVVDLQRQEKQRLLNETKNQEANYRTLITQREALKQQFETELFEYESQLRFVLDPSSIPPPGTPVLSWPLESVYITQQFGKTADSQRLYLSGSHSGTDFRASVGTPVAAMGPGRVIAAGDTDVACRGASFGKWVLIQYDNGLASTYGHLSLVRAQKGQRVQKGTVVAYSGNTGHSTGPHLHVSLYVAAAVEVSGKESRACKGKILVQPRAATNAYLNPLDYMPYTTSDMFKPGA